MSWLRRILPLLSAASLFAGDFDLLPPKTRVLLGLHIRGVAESTLARSLAPEVESAAGDWRKIVAAAGFDPLHDLDEVLIASAGEGQNAPVLIIARGSFDRLQIPP